MGLDQAVNPEDSPGSTPTLKIQPSETNLNPHESRNLMYDLFEEKLIFTGTSQKDSFLADE